MIEIGGLQLSFRELVDIGLVALIYYYLISLVRGTRAVSVIYGLLFLLIVYWVSGEFGLSTLHWLLTNFLGSIFLVIIILFQKDIRKALSNVGAGHWWRKSVVHEHAVEEVARACSIMARDRIGALIVIEKNVALGDIVERGVELDAAVSKELIMTIFHPDTPLHDGAAVIKDDRIAAASCILPLATPGGESASMGTRHRAALGISEESDALTIVVSEERGTISMAYQGQVTKLNEERLRKVLRGGG